jgi:hypothetical protein
MTLYCVEQSAQVLRRRGVSLGRLQLGLRQLFSMLLCSEEGIPIAPRCVKKWVPGFLWGRCRRRCSAWARMFLGLGVLRLGVGSRRSGRSHQSFEFGWQRRSTSRRSTSLHALGGGLLIAAAGRSGSARAYLLNFHIDLHVGCDSHVFAARFRFGLQSKNSQGSRVAYEH